MLGKMFVLSKACPVQGVMWHKKQKYNIFRRKNSNVFVALFLCFKRKMAAVRLPFSPL
jgi:hypothetical protein